MQPDYDRLLEEQSEEPIELSDDGSPQSPRDATATFDHLLDGNKLVLSREQTTMFALQRNLELQVELLTPVIAGTFEEIERGEFDPEVYARLEYLKEVSSETSRSTGEQFSVEGEDIGGAAGIRQSLPTGTDLDLRLSQDRSISNRAPEQQEARVGLTVTQQLLRGFGPAVNLASVRQAQLDAVASAYELRGFVEALVAESEIAYWQYVLAQQEIDIFERSLEISQQQSDEVELRIEVGTLPDNDAAAARAEVALNQQDLINARSLLRERQLRLLRLINSDLVPSEELTIEPASPPEIDPEPVEDAPERIQLAYQARPDLNEARLRLQQDRLETIVTRNGLLPRLELFADLGVTGFSDRFNASVREIKNRDTYDYSVGFQFNHYLGNRAAEARDRAARASRDQAAEAVNNLTQLVELEILLAMNEVERTRQQIHATEASRILQQQTYEAERERFDVGTSTSLLVSQAQRDLLASRIAEVEAVINYRIALVELYLAEGSLLQRRGITLAGTEEPVFE